MVSVCTAAAGVSDDNKPRLCMQDGRGLSCVTFTIPNVVMRTPCWKIR
jgi:hypothetical protein